MKRNDELYICTTLTRPDLYGGTGQFDVLVHFKLTHYRSGSPDSWEDPGYGPECEFDFLRAEFDGDHDDAPDAMTAAEIEQLKKWFETDGFDEACEIATREMAEVCAAERDMAAERRYEGRCYG
jgi:hypothetical protein